MKAYQESLRRLGQRFWLYGTVFGKWLAVSAVIGVSVGAVGAVFHNCVHYAAELWAEYPWLLWCLPLAGLAIVGFYRLMGVQGQGTNTIIDAVHEDRRLSWRLAPAIFLGTVLTHLCGGSAGREGAALQIGGTIGQGAGRLLRLDDEDLRIATLSGMAACFSALFGTPLTAVLFAIMGISVGMMYDAAMVPCLLSALAAYGVSLLLGVAPTRFAVEIPALAPATFFRVAVLALLCALVSILFCWAVHSTEHLMTKRIPNPWLRVAVGGAVIIALTYLVGCTDYNGAGMDIVAAAIEQGTAKPTAFLWNLLFTAVTLAAGFKGGEVVPSFFVGAAFGGAAGPLLGLPAGFSAAVGLVALFCGAANCPIASIILSVELFGAEGLLYYALACGVSYMVSGRGGLYSSQAILYSKWKLPATAAGMTVPAEPSLKERTLK